MKVERTPLGGPDSSAIGHEETNLQPEAPSERNRELTCHGLPAAAQSNGASLLTKSFTWNDGCCESHRDLSFPIWAAGRTCAIEPVDPAFERDSVRKRCLSHACTADQSVLSSSASTLKQPCSCYRSAPAIPQKS